MRKALEVFGGGILMAWIMYWMILLTAVVDPAFSQVL